jgi:23S rRNA pseudouridine955/2504/2580 synthase
MKEIIIEKSESGIRLNKYLKKIFPKMPEPLIYKLIRKKYFKINNKKVAGNETLNGEDVLSIFLGDETYNKYYYKNEQKNDKSKFDERYKQNFVYEDDNIIIFNKPVGLLSQGSNKNDE